MSLSVQGFTKAQRPDSREQYLWRKRRKERAGASERPPTYAALGGRARLPSAAGKYGSKAHGLGSERASKKRKKRQTSKDDHGRGRGDRDKKSAP